MKFDVVLAFVVRYFSKAGYTFFTYQVFNNFLVLTCFLFAFFWVKPTLVGLSALMRSL